MKTFFIRSSVLLSTFSFFWIKRPSKIHQVLSLRKSKKCQRIEWNWFIKYIIFYSTKLLTFIQKENLNLFWILQFYYSFWRFCLEWRKSSRSGNKMKINYFRWIWCFSSSHKNSKISRQILSIKNLHKLNKAIEWK